MMAGWHLSKIWWVIIPWRRRREHPKRSRLMMWFTPLLRSKYRHQRPSLYPSWISSWWRTSRQLTVALTGLKLCTSCKTQLVKQWSRWLARSGPKAPWNLKKSKPNHCRRMLWSRPISCSSTTLSKSQLKTMLTQWTSLRGTPNWRCGTLTERIWAWVWTTVCRRTRYRCIVWKPSKTRAL